MGSFTLLFSACQKRFYQVYEVASEQLDHKKDALVFENSEVKVRYNLWSQQGELAFVIENKTDEDLFIDLSRSFLIKNGEAMDYYEDLQQSTQTTRSATTSVGGGCLQSAAVLGQREQNKHLADYACQGKTHCLHPCPFMEILQQIFSCSELVHYVFDTCKPSLTICFGRELRKE